ncbi:hypothetical protein [Rheinheimera sp.]|uniref:hypothetical protein n=1 Tax=Rheinheimera sp. TaxID=1869214 RepID=UPI002FDE01CA
MESIFGFFESLFKNFTWGRLTFIVLTFLLAAACLLTYESYTGYLKLNRISTELKIINEIVELEKKIETLPEKSPSKLYFNRLMVEAEKSPMEFKFQPGFSSYKFERLSYQIAPWALLLVLIFLTTSKGKGSALAGVTMIGSPFVILGYNLPEFEKSWIVNYLYPWGTLLLILMMILWWQSRQKK